MNLLLLRHGDAEKKASSDFARKLTAVGRAQAEAVGRFLRGLGVMPDAIISSPLVRAVETAAATQEAVGKKIPLHEDERLACGMTPDSAYELLWEQEKACCVMLVGHEPDLSNLCADLSGMASAANFEMKKASCALFEVEKPGHACGALKWLVTPKLLSAMGED